MTYFSQILFSFSYRSEQTWSIWRKPNRPGRFATASGRDAVLSRLFPPFFFVVKASGTWAALATVDYFKRCLSWTHTSSQCCRPTWDFFRNVHSLWTQVLFPQQWTSWKHAICGCNVSRLAWMPPTISSVLSSPSLYHSYLSACIFLNKDKNASIQCISLGYPPL